MRFIDITIQTLLIIAALITGIISWASQQEVLYTYSMTIQCTLFGWQLIGSSFCQLLECRDAEIKQKHLCFASIYIALASLMVMFTRTPELSSIYTFFILAPGWALATFYYYVTCKFFFARKQGGGFLPHLGF